MSLFPGPPLLIFTLLCFLSTLSNPLSASPTLSSLDSSSPLDIFGTSQLSMASVLHDFQSVYLLPLGAAVRHGATDSSMQAQLESRIARVMRDEWNMTVKHVEGLESGRFIESYAAELAVTLPTSSPCIILSAHGAPEPSLLLTPLKHMHSVTLLLGDFDSQQSVLNALDTSAALHMFRMRHVRLITTSYKESHTKRLIRDYLVDGSTTDTSTSASSVKFDVGNSIFLRSIQKDAYARGAKMGNDLVRGKNGGNVICTTQQGSSHIASADIDAFTLQLYGFHKEHVPVGELLRISRQEPSEKVKQQVRDVIQWISETEFKSEVASLTPEQQLEESIRFYLTTLDWAQMMKCDVLNLQSDEKYAPWGVNLRLAQSLLSTLHNRPEIFSKDALTNGRGHQVLHYSLADQTAAMDTHMTRLVWQAYDVPVITHLFSIAQLHDSFGGLNLDEPQEDDGDEEDTLLVLRSEYPVPTERESLVVWSRLVRNADDFTCFIGIGQLEMHREEKATEERIVLRLQAVRLRDFVHTYYSSQIQVSVVPHESQLRTLVAAKAGLCQASGMSVVLNGASIHLIDEQMIQEFSTATNAESSGETATQHDEL